jgi:DNA-binding response OmpR family regulator
MSEEKKTILSVDDDLDTLNIIRFKLEAHGFNVITAQDGGQAMSLVRKHNPDLIILDVMMPKLNGFTLARLLKRDKRYQDIPQVLLTARSQDVDRALGKEVGVDLYLTKPFDPEKLLNEVRRLLGETA